MDPVTVRAFCRDTDVSPLLRLLQEAEAFDKTGESWSSEKLALYLNAPGHDPERERWVTEDQAQPGTLLGHAALYLPHADDERRIADGAVLVHPTQRRCGLGRELMARLEQYAVQHPDISTLRLYLDSTNEGAKAFARHHGLRAHAANAYRRMVSNLAEVPPKATFPEGFTLASHRTLGSLSRVVEAMNRCYAGLYGHRTTSESAFAPILEEADPDGFFLLLDTEGRVVGTVSAEKALDLSEQRGVPTGRLGSPGVVPEYRILDLYRALLITGCSYLKTQGVVWAELETQGEAETTIAAYKDLGFALRAEAVAYTKEL